METRVIEERTPVAMLADTAGDMLDVVVGLEQCIATMTALRARAIDQTHAWFRSSGLATPRAGTWDAETTARRVTVSELAAALRIPESAAERLVAESSALVHDLPATLAVLARGDISYRHATAVVDNAQSLPPEAVADYEAAVLPRAAVLSTTRFREAARRLRERLHPASMSDRRAAAADRRGVTVDPARDGMAWLTAYLPAEQALAIDDRLDRIAAGLRSPDETRTFAHLRADALCDLLTCGETPHDETGSGGGLGHGIVARVLVTVPVLSLLGLGSETDTGTATLEGYGPTSADLARILAAGAPSFTRLLTHPETGAVLSVGRDSYTVPADLRTWLRARDETCRHTGCGRRAAGCDIDHTRDWQHAGDTTHDNLAHLCRRHHQLKHHTDWTPRHLPGGILEWTSPSGRTYLTEPSSIMRT